MNKRVGVSSLPPERAVGICQIDGEKQALYYAELGERELAKSMLSMARRWGIEVLEQAELVDEIARAKGLAELSESSKQSLSKLLRRNSN